MRFYITEFVIRKQDSVLVLHFMQRGRVWKDNRKKREGKIVYHWFFDIVRTNRNINYIYFSTETSILFTSV